MQQRTDKTDEEKLAIYMKCSKKKLAEMLLECNRMLGNKKTKFTIVNSDKDK